MNGNFKWLITVSVLAMMIFSFSIVSSLIIPVNEKAKDYSPVTDENSDLVRVDYVSYAQDYARGGGNEKPAKPVTCYKLMGVKWKTTPVAYTINPTNDEGLSEEFVTGAISTSAETWDTETSTELFDDSYSVNTNAEYGTRDNVNAIVFGNYPTSNVIAVTSVWYNQRTKAIVEFDMLFDTDFTWGDASVDSSLMDLQNIATHELGHAVGMNDIYTSSCSAVTMYGYSYEGDLAKRTLETPDITGLQKMYGV